jgi:hypothetical protein
VEQLPTKDRAYLAERLIASLDEGDWSSSGPAKPCAAAMKFVPAR